MSDTGRQVGPGQAQGMRIAWLTPLARSSAIGRYSLAAVRALSEKADIDVLYPPTGDDLECPWANSTIELGDPSHAVDLLRPYDAVLYNLGNNVDFHADIFEYYLRRPGICILHDKVMQGFFASYTTLRRGDPLYYVCLMTYLYGDRGRATAIKVLREGWTRSLEMRTAAEFPLFEPCLFNATGAVVHSYGTGDVISARYGRLLPVATIQLPEFIYDLEYERLPLLSRTELGLPDDKVAVVASGRMNAPKRLGVLIRAVASDPDLRERVLLVMAGGGDPDYIDRLRRVARDCGLSERVRFVSDPDDRTLHSLIVAADICASLRNPSTETASAALVEQLHFGKAVLVSRVGVFDEYPDDVVEKTDIADEVVSVGNGLRHLVLDEGHRSRVASAGKEYCRVNHSSDVYARQLIDFLISGRSPELARVDQAAIRLLGEAPGEPLRQAVRVSAKRIAASMTAGTSPESLGSAR